MSSSATEGQPGAFARNVDEDTSGHVRAFSGPNADEDGAAEGAAGQKKEQDDDAEGHRWKSL